MLVAARLKYIGSITWGKRRYLAIETLLNLKRRRSLLEIRIDGH
jgi:hypothetical protein